MNAGTTYNQRDIILMPFPYSDLTGAKLRPAVIISNQNLKGEDKLCCLITSNKSSDGITLNKRSFEDKELPFESIVKPHRIFSVNERIIKKKISKITKEFHQKIINNILEKIT